MSQSEYRFLLNVKNSIKKSMSVVLLGVAHCRDLFDEDRSIRCWGLPSFVVAGEEDVQAKSKINFKDPGFEEVALDEQVISQLFVGFFNNKMTLPVFLIQSKGMVPSAKLVSGAISFLDDIYRHMLTKEQQSRAHLIFKWLRLFFKKLPSVSSKQRQKALTFIYQLYFILGIRPKWSIVKSSVIKTGVQ